VVPPTWCAPARAQPPRRSSGHRPAPCWRGCGSSIPSPSAPTTCCNTKAPNHEERHPRPARLAVLPGLWVVRLGVQPAELYPGHVAPPARAPDPRHHRQLADPPLAEPQLRYPGNRSEEHTSELQSRENLVCRLLLEKKKEDG